MSWRRGGGGGGGGRGDAPPPPPPPNVPIHHPMSNTLCSPCQTLLLVWSLSMLLSRIFATFAFLPSPAFLRCMADALDPKEAPSQDFGTV